MILRTLKSSYGNFTEFAKLFKKVYKPLIKLLGGLY